MSNKPNVYESSDYSGLGAKGVSFYYGYEVTMCADCQAVNKHGSPGCAHSDDAEQEWCFTANVDGKEIVIPLSKLGCDDRGSMLEPLLHGIGWIFAKYKLVQIDAPA